MLAIKHNNNNSEALYYLGFILIQEGRIKEAINYLKRSLELNEEISDAYYYLGIALARNNRKRML